MFTDITKERYEQLSCFWCEETCDPYTQEWRDDLTAEEAQLVASWDRSACIDIRKLCERILELTPDVRPSLNV